MDDLYNIVLATYIEGFASLAPKTQFHFSSRLYLWHQDAWAARQLKALEPGFSGNGRPMPVLKKLLEEPLSPLGQTNRIRAPYLERFPDLRAYNKALFRLLFINSIYGIDERSLVYELFSKETLARQRDQLLSESVALTRLSSIAINFLYLLERYVHDDDSVLPVATLLEIGRANFNGNAALERQLQCYFFTHCIIAESLFYYRHIPDDNKQIYLEMLANTERIISDHFEEVKLDNSLEFLVCCHMLGYSSRLEGRIIDFAKKNLSSQGYIAEPLVKSPANLGNAEHRNVLFLLSQKNYQPLNA